MNANILSGDPPETFGAANPRDSVLVFKRNDVAQKIPVTVSGDVFKDGHYDEHLVEKAARQVVLDAIGLGKPTDSLSLDRERYERFRVLHR